jgi:predicted RNase H-like HicB family nuclease/post-segregation antitoxin (ccd killing protein)
MNGGIRVQYVYPAVFHPEPEGGFSVFFPDIKRGATQGDTIAQCIDMAEDFLCLALYRMEEDKLPIPAAGGIKEVESEPDDIVTLISVDTETYRRYYENKLVKKTLNIPSWLNERAEAANVNFSKTLQRALKEELQLTAAE